MDHVVQLDKLPEGIEFPSKLKDRIHYAAEKHRMVFQGFMSKSEFDSLARLSKDLAYQRAVDELFRISTESAQRPVPWLGPTIVAVGSLGLILVGLAWWLLVNNLSGTATEEPKLQSASWVPRTSRVQE